MLRDDCIMDYCVKFNAQAHDAYSKYVATHDGITVSSDTPRSIEYRLRDKVSQKLNINCYGMTFGRITYLNYVEQIKDREYEEAVACNDRLDRKKEEKAVNDDIIDNLRKHGIEETYGWGIRNTDTISVYADSRRVNIPGMSYTQINIYPRTFKRLKRGGFNWSKVAEAIKNIQDAAKRKEEKRLEKSIAVEITKEAMAKIGMKENSKHLKITDFGSVAISFQCTNLEKIKKISDFLKTIDIDLFA